MARLRLLRRSVPPTLFYVDAGRTSNGDGTAANPWKLRGNINWSTLASALSRGPVIVYFSSRASWSDNAALTIDANTINGDAVCRLTLDGQTKYNLAASGDADWQNETNPANLATLTNAGGTGGTIYILNGNSYITVRGFRQTAPTWGGVAFGTANPTQNIHDIVVENVVIDSPPNGSGVAGVYMEDGCYNFTVRNCTISNTPLEGIYIGHYDYVSPTITGVLVERNTLIDTGTSAEGDIDIKPGCAGAVVRYNTVYGTGTGSVLGGVVVAAPSVHVYGNTLRTLGETVGDGGIGIYVGADTGAAGMSVSDVLIYNNLIHSNERHGIRLSATKASSVIGCTVLNNTIAGNTLVGVRAIASGGGAITLESQNNIVSSNGSYAIEASTGVTLTSDYNCVYGTGDLFLYQGAVKTWAQWQALGFDANGANADPDLDASYVPQAGSAALGSGTVRAEFSVDKNGTTRAVPWDMGAYEA